MTIDNLTGLFRLASVFAKDRHTYHTQKRPQEEAGEYFEPMFA